MASMNFDELINELHSNSTLIDTELSTPIEIDNRRQFIIPNGYNTTIAYVGDINSQIITFDLPSRHEGHSLSNCDVKKLYWKNLASSIEGHSNLTAIEGGKTNRQLLQWNAPPEAFTQAGALEISISLYDIYNDKIAFAWNTATFSSLNVAATMDSIGDKLPARDEILTINEETRQIVAPAGYNNTIAFQGDIGVGKVYFLIKRYIKNIDLLNTNCQILVFYKAAGLVKTSVLSKLEYSPEISDRLQEGMILLTWTVPDGVGEILQAYNGKIEISLQVSTTAAKWHTSSYSNLEIKPSFTTNQNNTSDTVGAYLQSSAWLINGNDIVDANEAAVLSGVVSLRVLDNPLNSSLKLADNEILPYYDENGKLLKVYINTPKGLVAIGSSTQEPDTPEEPDAPSEEENYAMINGEYLLTSSGEYLIIE